MADVKIDGMRVTDAEWDMITSEIRAKRAQAKSNGPIFRDIHDAFTMTEILLDVNGDRSNQWLITPAQVVAEREKAEKWDKCNVGMQRCMDVAEYDAIKADAARFRAIERAQGCAMRVDKRWSLLRFYDDSRTGGYDTLAEACDNAISAWRAMGISH